MKTRTISVNVDGKEPALKYSLSRLVSPARQRTENSIRSPHSMLILVIFIGLADLKSNSIGRLPPYEKLKAALNNHRDLLSAWTPNKDVLFMLKLKLSCLL